MILCDPREASATEPKISRTGPVRGIDRGLSPHSLNLQ
jgi:hypothetical protein